MKKPYYIAYKNHRNIKIYHLGTIMFEGDNMPVQRCGQDEPGTVGAHPIWSETITEGIVEKMCQKCIIALKTNRNIKTKSILSKSSIDLSSLNKERQEIWNKVPN